MVYVRIELWPRGNRANATLLGEIKIANTGKGTATHGDYTGELMVRGDEIDKGRVWKRSVVNSFPRRRLGGYDLVYRILRNAVGVRNV